LYVTRSATSSQCSSEWSRCAAVVLLHTAHNSRCSCRKTLTGKPSEVQYYTVRIVFRCWILF